MLWLISSVIMIVLDGLFLRTLQPVFEQTVQRIQGSPLQLNLRGVIPCYIFLVLVLNYFIIYPHKSPLEAFLLGICINGIYETTNYSIFKNWPLYTVIIDILWGGTLFALVTWITYAIAHKYKLSN
jgi:uncharacterized membrane protein